MMNSEEPLTEEPLTEEPRRGEAVRGKRTLPVWPQLRRLIIFQLKLYIDAFRDFFLSLLSFVAFVLDVITNNHGPGSHFENVLKLGRRTERAINLFDQYSGSEAQGGKRVDDFIDEVEERFRQRNR